MKVRSIIKNFVTLGLSGVAGRLAVEYNSNKTNLAWAHHNREGEKPNFKEPVINLKSEEFKGLSFEELLNRVGESKHIGYIIGLDDYLNNDPRTKQEIEKKLIKNNQNYQKHPSDYVHALLSAHAYINCKVGEEVKFGPGTINANKRNEHLKGWKVQAVYNKPYAVSYINEDEHQLVLAYRGTTIKMRDLISTSSPLMTDITEILDAGTSKATTQGEAHKVTLEVASYAQQEGYNLSLTGHSLGAWLAEVSLYYCQFDPKCKYKGGAKAITFDSPGAVKTYETYKSNVLNKQNNNDPRDLDIVTYLSKPNFINSCNPHVGRVFELPTSTDSLPQEVTDYLSKLGKLPFIGSTVKDNKYFIDGILSLTGHKLDSMIEAFDPETGKAKEGCKQVKDWPCIKYTPKENSSISANYISKAIESITIGKLLQITRELLMLIL